MRESLRSRGISPGRGNSDCKGPDLWNTEVGRGQGKRKEVKGVVKGSKSLGQDFGLYRE